jgi:hypothetical protein
MSLSRAEIDKLKCVFSKRKKLCQEVQFVSRYPSPAHTSAKLDFSNYATTEPKYRNRINAASDLRFSFPISSEKLK